MSRGEWFVFSTEILRGANFYLRLEIFGEGIFFLVKKYMIIICNDKFEIFVVGLGILLKVKIIKLYLV